MTNMQMTRANQFFKVSPKARQRHYLGFCYKGKPSEVIEVISQKVNEYDLSKLIPLLRVEKKDKNQQGKRREFYFFVAIEGVNNPQLEPKYQEFREKILTLKYFNRPAVKGFSLFTYEQIKLMVGKAHSLCLWHRSSKKRSQLT